MDNSELLRRYSAGERNFSGIRIEYANLYRMNLQDINLAEANLSEADLREADLRNVNLSGASLEDGDFRGANLENAQLVAASLSGASFQGANLTKANLTGANLAYSDFSQANLREADLQGANLTETKLEAADLTDTLFTVSQPSPESIPAESMAEMPSESTLESVSESLEIPTEVQAGMNRVGEGEENLPISEANSENLPEIIVAEGVKNSPPLVEETKPTEEKLGVNKHLKRMVSKSPHSEEKTPPPE